MAFISNFGVGGSTRNLFVMEPEAPEQGFNLAVQVTHFTSGVPLEEPVWSPDGTRLAFVLGNSESNDKIEVANSNGTTATPLVVTEHGVHPSWSPDSGKIAFSYPASRTLRTSSLDNRDDVTRTHPNPATTQSPVLATASRLSPT